MRHNGHVIELDDPAVGTTVQLAPPVRMDRTPASVLVPAPRLGEHTETVLAALDSPAEERSRPKPLAPPSRAPLEGVTVLEMSLFYASPYGTTLLADLGARVIKIEPLQRRRRSASPCRFRSPAP